MLIIHIYESLNNVKSSSMRLAKYTSICLSVCRLHPCNCGVLILGLVSTSLVLSVYLF
jgi:hypothetical protein